MNVWLWIAIGILIAIIIILSAKVHLMQKSAREIETAFADRLVTDTNTLIDISSGDRDMRRLASAINGQLRQLRTERRRFQQGDLELKKAITNISHDLRTPLTALCGYLELMKQTDDDEKAQMYLRQIEGRAEVLKQLIEELFQDTIAASACDDPRENLDLRRCLEAALLSFYAVMTQKGLVPEISMPETRVERHLNASALSRIFANIIGNAVKYGEGDLSVALDPSGKITFINTAPGLTQVEVGKLFDRFYTVKSGGKSTGLGLSIAKILTERIGGEISADYRDSQLSITIQFPPENDR